MELWAELEDTANQMELWLARPEMAEILTDNFNAETLSEEELQLQLNKLKVLQMCLLCFINISTAFSMDQCGVYTAGQVIQVDDVIPATTEQFLPNCVLCHLGMGW